MSLTAYPELPASRYFRVDTDHKLHEMMQRAVARLHGRDIGIQLHDRQVILTGTVRSWAEKQTAQESIRALSGSRRIVNELHVG
ncbi:MAG: BON domain-containing protein [Planctomycetaceae bacterium]